jgi:hypothetical protein
MSGANYEYCGFCDSKAFYVGEEDVPEGVEVVHTDCLERDRAARERQLREQIAREIEAVRRDHDQWPQDAQDGFLDWHHGMDSAIEIARGNISATAATSTKDGESRG